jgi:hypothetical protein
MSSLQKFHRRTQSGGGVPAVKVIGSEAPVAGAGFYLGIAGDGTSYMYVAPKSTESGNLNWGSFGVVRSTYSNDGLINTNTLYSFGQAAHPAAYYCKTLTTGGYNTWYMPSLLEVQTIYTNHAATPFSTSNGVITAAGKYYMTSTESGNVPANNATYLGMANGLFYGGYNNKNQSTAYGLFIRAVRRSTI